GMYQKKARSMMFDKLDDIGAYVENTTKCRRQMLHFGEEAPAHCGNCDICLGTFQKDATAPAPVKKGRTRTKAAENKKGSVSVASVEGSNFNTEESVVCKRREREREGQRLYLGRLAMSFILDSHSPTFIALLLSEEKETDTQVRADVRRLALYGSPCSAQTSRIPEACKYRIMCSLLNIS
ncbi:hypothetical protein PROFUN_10533, partial [Planoprotostelium fungivorum]